MMDDLLEKRKALALKISIGPKDMDDDEDSLKHLKEEDYEKGDEENKKMGMAPELDAEKEAQVEDPSDEDKMAFGKEAMESLMDDGDKRRLMKMMEMEKLGKSQRSSLGDKARMEMLKKEMSEES